VLTITLTFSDSRPPKIDTSSFLTHIEYNAEFSYHTEVLQRDEHCHRVWMDNIEQALKSSMGMSLGTGVEKTAQQYLLKNNLTESLPQPHSQRNEFEWNRSVEMDEQKPSGDESFNLGAPAKGEFDEFVHSDLFMDGAASELPDLSEKRGPAERLRPLAPRPSPDHLHMGPSLATEDTAWSLNPETKPAYTNTYMSQINPYMEDTSLDVEDFLNGTEGPNSELNDFEIQDTEALLQPSMEYDWDIPFSAPEDRTNAVYPSYDFNNMEELLSFESTLPGANGSIKDVRDMSRGLIGRYEFDGSM
jgi:hypothetical protein